MIQTEASSLKDLATQETDVAANANQAAANPPADEAEPRTPKLDAQGRAYATGRRKESAARVWIKPGKGHVIVNQKSMEEHFTRGVLCMLIHQPFAATGTEGKFDVYCTVKGGGLSGQAGAVRHAISRALDNFNPELHTILRQGGFLTRDSRAVERKKYGRRKARRKFQFSKR